MSCRGLLFCLSTRIQSNLLFSHDYKFASCIREIDYAHCIQPGHDICGRGVRYVGAGHVAVDGGHAPFVEICEQRRLGLRQGEEGVALRAPSAPMRRASPDAPLYSHPLP